MIKNIILTSACEDKNLKGILTLENTSNNTLVTLKTYNLNDYDGKLILGIKTNGEFYKVELNNDSNYLINKKLDLNEKISAVVINSNLNKTKTLVWGSNETTKVWKDSILYEIDKKDDIQKNSYEQSLNLNENSAESLSYNDYETDEEIETIVENALNDEEIQEDKEENVEDNKKDFLSSVGKQVEELLNSYEAEHTLEELIPNSKFVKVKSEGENFYIFGVIYENNEIKYIVYGIPGEFSVKPDDEYKNFYQWLPLNSENPDGYGYYLMYQDALTGEQIEIMFE